jgi:hypothetical protein
MTNANRLLIGILIVFLLVEDPPTEPCCQRVAVWSTVYLAMATYCS